MIEIKSNHLFHDAWKGACRKGQKGEDIIQNRFLKAGWSVLPTGLTDPNASPPRLRTPTGILRPCDFIGFHPDGRRLWIVEAKFKTRMKALNAYGMDRQSQDDRWEDLQRHDRLGGPVLLAIHDWRENIEIAATVSMLQADGGPQQFADGKFWYWSADRFMPLSFFIKL